MNITNEEVTDSSETITDSVGDEKKKYKITEETKNMTPEDIKTKIEDTKAEIKEMEDSGANERRIKFRKKRLDILEQTLKKMRISSGNLTDTEKIIRDSGISEGEGTFSATTTTRTTWVFLQ